MQLPSPDRVFETLLGFGLGVASLLPLVLALGAPFLWGDTYEWPWAILGAAVSAAVFVWCARTAWRLLSGRPRKDGGLLSPWLIGAAGVIAAAGVVFGLTQFGMRWWGGALYLGSISFGCLMLARKRFMRRRDHAGAA